MIFICKIIEEASFASQITLGFGTRVDLRRDMIKDRSIRAIPPKKKKRVPRPENYAKIPRR